MTAVDRAALAGPTLGTVDLVAIERVRAGLPVELNEDDWRYLAANLTGSNEEARLVGQALGLEERSVQRICQRARDAQQAAVP